MERFLNGDTECIVLMRAGDVALIVRPGCTCQPYVVPLQHRQGDTDWWQGHYYSDFEGAYAEYRERIGDSGWLDAAVEVPADEGDVT